MRTYVPVGPSIRNEPHGRLGAERTSLYLKINGSINSVLGENYDLFLEKILNRLHIFDDYITNSHTYIHTYIHTYSIAIHI
jgi:hypothetical protein